MAAAADSVPEASRAYSTCPAHVVQRSIARLLRLPRRMFIDGRLAASSVMQLVVGEGIALAPALCEAVQALLARLQEQVAAASTADPLGGMPLPARCHDLLQMLLEVAWQVRSGAGHLRFRSLSGSTLVTLGRPRAARTARGTRRHRQRAAGRGAFAGCAASAASAPTPTLSPTLTGPCRGASWMRYGCPCTVRWPRISPCAGEAPHNPGSFCWTCVCCMRVAQAAVIQRSSAH